MPTPKKGARLGGSPAHQKLILKNLATQLIEHRSLTTTEAKAKALRPFVEKLVTKAKRGDMHARRTVARVITDKNALYTLFDVIAPALDPERQGGYTRLTRVGNRKGDNAPLMRIELVMQRLRKLRRLLLSAPKRLAKRAISPRLTRLRKSQPRPAKRLTPLSRSKKRSDLFRVSDFKGAGTTCGTGPFVVPIDAFVFLAFSG